MDDAFSYPPACWRLPLELLQHVLVELQGLHRLARGEALRQTGHFQIPERIGKIEVEGIDIFILRFGIAFLVQIRDRKRVVWGKSVSVRVDLGGRRILKKKIKIQI